MFLLIDQVRAEAVTGQAAFTVPLGQRKQGSFSFCKLSKDMTAICLGLASIIRLIGFKVCILCGQIHGLTV